MMEDQNTFQQYSSKANYCKRPEQNNRSSIRESFKGLCTNIWYKLGGESIMNRKPNTDFQNLVMLGKKYNNYQDALEQIKSLMWFTYRKEIKLTGEYKSDLGWGCLIRVGQMLLANTLKRFFANKGVQINDENLLFSFLDDQQGKQNHYSLRRILNKGAQKFNLKIGDWYNISQICYILMILQNTKPLKGSEELKILYFNQTLIFLDEVFQKINIQICRCKQRKICCPFCNGQINHKKKRTTFQSANSDSIQFQFEDLTLNEDQKQNSFSAQEGQKISQAPLESSFDKKSFSFDLLIIVSTRLSQRSIEQKSFEGVLQLINLPFSMGLIGGVPGKGLYFIGSCDNNLIYLDPHLVQNPVNKFNLSKQINTFHCQNFRLIGRQKLDSSIAFAFYIQNLGELQQLIAKIEKIKRKNPDAVPISYMWQNEFRDSSEIICSNDYEIQQSLNDMSFVA